MRIVTMLSLDEWRAEATRRFGPDLAAWRFQCPGCGNTQTASDFEGKVAPGCIENAVTRQCVGRFLPPAETLPWLAPLTAPLLGPSPTRPSGVRCDYAVFGAFDITRTRVRYPNGTVVSVFDFAEAV